MSSENGLLHYTTVSSTITHTSGLSLTVAVIYRQGSTYKVSGHIVVLSFCETLPFGNKGTKAVKIKVARRHFLTMMEELSPVIMTISFTHNWA